MKFINLAGLAVAAAVILPAAAANAADAPAAFNACKACHKTEAGGKAMGPSLFGVVGRKAGTLDGFAYSPAMKAHGAVWTPEALAAYITDPKAAVPGNKMPFAGTHDAAKSKEIVQYLETLK